MNGNKYVLVQLYIFFLFKKFFVDVSLRPYQERQSFHSLTIIILYTIFIEECTQITEATSVFSGDNTVDKEQSMSYPNCSSYPMDNGTDLECSDLEITQGNTTTIDEIFFDIRVFRIIHYVLGSLGSLLNVGTLIALFKNTSHIPQLTFLASLSLSDMIIALLSTFYYDVCFESVWLFYDRCNTLGGVHNSSLESKYVRYTLGLIYTMSQCAGILTLYAISIDILCAVSKPLYYKQCNICIRAKWLVVSIWLLSFLAVCVEGFITMYPFNITFQEQRTLTPFRPLLMIFSSLSLLPFVIMYSITIYKIWRHVTNSPSRQSRNMKKAAITLILIIGSYFLCMTPAVWVLILALKSRSIDFYTIITFLHVFHALYVCNTVLDPLVYALRIPEVRQYFKKFLRLSYLRSFRTSTNFT